MLDALKCWKCYCHRFIPKPPNLAKAWYEQQITKQKANPDRPLLVDQNNRYLTERVEKLGQNVAQTEREVRSKIAAKFQPETPKS